MTLYQAAFTRSNKDLFWVLYVLNGDGFIRWQGYDDANWWSNVAPTRSATERLGQHTGTVYVLNHETNEVRAYSVSEYDAEMKR